MSLNLVDLGITSELLRRTTSVDAEEFLNLVRPATREADGWAIAFSHLLCLTWKSSGSMSWPQQDWHGEVTRSEDTLVVLTLTRIRHGEPRGEPYPSPPDSATKYVITFTLRPAQT